MSKEMYCYIITFSNGNGYGYGSCDIESKKPLQSLSVKEFRELEKNIEKRSGGSKLVILNIIPINNEEHIINMNDNFVVCCERDTYKEESADNQPICFETFLNKSTLKDAKKFQKRIGTRYGKTRIAKLVFIED